jgi:hypothetical protein
METLDMDYSLFQRQGAGDDKLLVVFRDHYSPDHDASDREGRPMFKDAVYIKIITPGDRDNIIDREMRPEDKFRFPRQYAAFQAGQAEIGDGTRLEEWPQISRSQVEELRYMHIRTVEQLANLKDDIMSKATGLRGLSERAKLFLEAAAGAAPALALKAELEKRDEQIAALQNSVAELTKLAQPAPGGEPIVAVRAK